MYILSFLNCGTIELEPKNTSHDNNQGWKFIQMFILMYNIKYMYCRAALCEGTRKYTGISTTHLLAICLGKKRKIY